VNTGAAAGYEFGDLPIDPVAPGTNLLVSGPALGGTREVALQMLAAGESRSDGLLLIATEDTGEVIFEDYVARGGAFDRGRMAAIDCSEGQSSSDDANVETVTSPGDLTGIGIAYSSLYEGLYAEGIERVRTGMFSVSTLLMYADEIQPVYRFLHTFTGRVQSADGVGICVVDPTPHDEQTIGSIMQSFDGQIEVRHEAGQHGLRVRGLPDQSEEWRPISLGE
jgi:hypothetical protein